MALVLAALALALVRDQVETRPLRALLLQWHRTAGVLVLGLFCYRVLLWSVRRFRRPIPPVPGAKAMQWLATLMHWTLYVLMLMVPVMGYLLSNAHGPASLALGIELPALLEPDPDLADEFEGWHLRLAWTLLILAGLHGLAAVGHHVLGRDRLLHRMGWSAARPAVPSHPSD